MSGVPPHVAFGAYQATRKNLSRKRRWLADADLHKTREALEEAVFAAGPLPASKSAWLSDWKITAKVKIGQGWVFGAYADLVIRLRRITATHTRIDYALGAEISKSHSDYERGFERFDDKFGGAMSQAFATRGISVEPTV